MTKIKNWMVGKIVEREIAKEEGQGLAEYGLILALIAVVCIAALQLLGGGIAATLGSLTAQL